MLYNGYGENFKVLNILYTYELLHTLFLNLRYVDSALIGDYIAFLNILYTYELLHTLFFKPKIC